MPDMPIVSSRHPRAQYKIPLNYQDKIGIILKLIIFPGPKSKKLLPVKRNSLYLIIKLK